MCLLFDRVGSLMDLGDTCLTLQTVLDLGYLVEITTGSQDECQVKTVYSLTCCRREKKAPDSALGRARARGGGQTWCPKAMTEIYIS